MSKPPRRHSYSVTTTWIGNHGTGTSAYAAYGRDHTIAAAGKPTIAGSSDPVFRGDAGRWNPEELLVASLSACHQLWFLHLCADAGLIVLAYEDHASGIMEETPAGGGRFVAVTLRPRITLGSGDRDRAVALHHAAHEHCFIAQSVNFPVRVDPDFIS